MTHLFEMSLNPQKLKDYQEKDLEYKSHVRNILIKKLGFEPPLTISILSEISLRGAYRRFEQGESTASDLENCLQFHLDFIQRLMCEESPTFNC